MRKLSQATVGLLFFLAIVYNIERLDFQQNTVVNLQSFFYFLVTAAVISTITIQKIQRLPVALSVALWVAVYLIAKLFLFTYRPLFGSYFTYLTITETVLLVISIFLSHQVAIQLIEVETIVERVTFPKNGQRVRPLGEAVEDIKTEFIRSRRHNRPLCVLVLEMNPTTTTFSLEKAIKNIQQSMVTRYFLASLGKVISKEARRTDLILEEADDNRFVLLCPETTAQGTTALAERIQEIAMEKLGVSIRYGIAAFPEDELIFENLLKKAQQEVQEGAEEGLLNTHPVEKVEI